MNVFIDMVYILPDMAACECHTQGTVVVMTASEMWLNNESDSVCGAYSGYIVLSLVKARLENEESLCVLTRDVWDNGVPQKNGFINVIALHAVW